MTETSHPEKTCIMIAKFGHKTVQWDKPLGDRKVVGTDGKAIPLEKPAADHRLPEIARACVAALGSQLRALKAQILEFDRRIIAWHRSSATSKRLDAIPGVGPALATALVASIADPKAFRSGRDFSAGVGLVPKQNSSGGKDKLGAIAICAAFLQLARSP